MDLIRATIVAAALVFCGSAQAEIYWSDQTLCTIGRADDNGGNVDPDFIDASTGGSCLPRGVAVDDAHVYWADNSNHRIGRAELDGSAVDPDFIPLAGSPFPSGVAVDGSYIYWGEPGGLAPTRGSIGRANVDGTNLVRPFVDAAVNGPVGLTVDPRYIYSGNLSTLGRSEIGGGALNESFITGGSSTKAPAVNATHIFWANQDSQAIGRANLDGSGANQSFIDLGDVDPDAVAINDTHIYWASYLDTQIGRANLDGSGVQPNFITGVAPNFITASQPAPAPPPDVPEAKVTLVEGRGYIREPGKPPRAMRQGETISAYLGDSIGLLEGGKLEVRWPGLKPGIIPGGLGELKVGRAYELPGDELKIIPNFGIAGAAKKTTYEVWGPNAVQGVKG